ncbi:MAG TPA: PPOX class F420-dependent oxidoreductase [Nitrososphaerales archaeon]|nr:PPOX class F420-dependent oxidoreductase [Nitrososphaerales archaeon]
MKQLTEQAKKLIDGKNFASVATLMPNGSPQVAPVWVDRDGDIILINSAESRQRIRNLKRDPRIALTIFDQEDPYTRVSIRGRVIEMTKNGAEEHIDKLQLKYRGTPKYPNHNPKDPRVIMKIEPHRISD